MPHDAPPLLKKTLRKGEQGKKSGRSIEETLVKRRLDVTDPLNWPPALQNGNLQALVMKAPANAVTSGVMVRRSSTMLPEEGRNLSPTRTVRASVEEIRARQLESLLNQRAYLEHKVMELEATIIQRDQESARQLIGTGGGSRAASRLRSRQTTPYLAPGSGQGRRLGESRGTNNPSSRSSADPFAFGEQSPSKMDVLAAAVEAIQGIDDRMSDLQTLFHRDDPGERKHSAATKITARVRGFLTRTNMTNYLRCMAEWRWSRCRHAVRCLDIMLSGQTTLDARIEQKQTIMETRLLRFTFGGWKSITMENADKRKDIAQATADLLAERRIKLMRKSFAVLFKYTVGPLSAKQLLRDRKAMAIAIRNELSATQMSKGLSGVVLPEEFRQWFRRKMVAKAEAARTHKLKQAIFTALVGVLRTAQWNEHLAKKAWYRNCAGKCFYYWTEWNFENSFGLDKKRWKAPRRYEVRYSQKRVDHFARIRVLKTIFKPWKEKQKIWREVNKRARNHRRRFMLRHFRALVEISKVLRALRIDAVATWKGYAPLMMSKPFREWALWVKFSIKSFDEKIQLATNYRRWKVRQQLLLIMRTWRHQALYGRTDGMYSRTAMAKNLKDQKAFADRCEKVMVSQVVELEECKDLIDREILKRRDLEERLQVAMADIQRHQMLLHHAEQEVKRLEAVVDAITIINPRQATHLRELYPDFHFKGRSLLMVEGAAEPVKEEQPAETQAPAPAPTAVAPAVAAEVVTLAAAAAAAVGAPGGMDGRAPNDLAETAHDSRESVVAAGGGGDGGVGLTIDTSLPAPIISLAPKVDMSDVFLLDRAKWVCERFGKHPEPPKPWEIIPPINEDEDDAEPEEFAPPHRKLSEYPEFGQRRLSSLFPGMVSRPANNTISVSTVGLEPADSASLPDPADGLSSSGSRRGSAAFVLFQKEQAELAALTAGTAEMREKVGRSVVMLVGLIDFLADGDVALFGADDKRDWARNVLNSFNESGSVASSLSALDGKLSPTAKIGASSGLPDATIDALLGIERGQKEVRHLTPKEKKKRMEEESALSWRTVLAHMRSLFPGGGSYAGVGIHVDPNVLLPQEGGYGDVPMYRKILELRHTQEIILQRKVGMRTDDLAKQMQNSSLFAAFEYGKDDGGTESESDRGEVLI